MLANRRWAKKWAKKDLNDDDHECIAEAFDTTHNVLILLYPVQALSSTTIIMPAGSNDHLKLGGSA